MRSKKRYIFFLLPVFVIASCKNILDLQPAQSISNETALEDDAGVKQALNGAYDLLSRSSLLGGELMRNAELYGGDGELLWVGTYTAPREIFERNILPTNGDVESFWTEAYACINGCNNVLHSIDVVDATDQDRVQGEALTIRAWCLFELTRCFGQQYLPGTDNSQPAVPIILDPTIQFGENSQVARNTVEECYAQVISDLTTAEGLLPETNGVFINKYVAAALLARVYLQQENYSAARDAADMVIASGNYDLLADYASCFNQDDNTNEDIFALQISTTDGINDMNTYFATNDFGGRSDIEILDGHLNLYPGGDLRKVLFYEEAGSYYSGKYTGEYANIPIIRLAEMYLIRAECNERLGTATGATPLEDFNAVHTRAGLPAAVSVNLDSILLERRLELADEGFKIYDIKRLHETVGGLNFDDPKLIYPIPENELEVDPLLVQNPGY